MYPDVIESKIGVQHNVGITHEADIILLYEDVILPIQLFIALKYTFDVAIGVGDNSDTSIGKWSNSVLS